MNAKDHSVTPRDILVEARAKIAQGWCQRSLARDQMMFPGDVDTNDPGATNWCSVGAICAAVGEPDFWDIRNRKNMPGYEAAKLLEQAVGEPIDPVGEFGALVWWNDAEGRTQTDVLAAYDRAIAAAQ